jgi:hypothetical protein
MKSLKLFLVGVLIAISAQANVMGPYFISGAIKSFDDKTVVMESQTFRYEIPREYVQQHPLKILQKLELALDRDQFKHIKLRKLK